MQQQGIRQQRHEPPNQHQLGLETDLNARKADLRRETAEAFQCQQISRDTDEYRDRQLHQRERHIGMAIEDAAYRDVNRRQQQRVAEHR